MAESVDDFLAHFGVKGMKWGVRKERDRKPLTKKQKVAIASSSAAVLAGGIAAAILLNKYANVRVEKLAAAEEAKKAADLLLKRSEALKSQTGIIHASRGKNIGFKVLRDGGSNSPLSAFDAFHPTDQGIPDETIRRIGDKAHVMFYDFEGRKDFSGRKIPHEVIVPFPLSAEIKDITDVKEKVWPLLKDTYDTFYEKSLDRGF